MGYLVDCDTGSRATSSVGSQRNATYGRLREVVGCVCRRFEQLAGPGTQACVTGQLSDCATVRRRLSALGDSGLSEFEI